MKRSKEESWAIHNEMRMVSRIRKYGYDNALKYAFGDEVRMVEERKDMNDDQLAIEWRRLCDKQNEK